MRKKLSRILAGTLSAVFVGQVMIYGDGTAQGILHADTIASAAEAIEEAKNAKQLKAEMNEATEGLGTVDFFSMPQANVFSMEQSDEGSAEITFASELTVTGFVQKGTYRDIQHRILKRSMCVSLMETGLKSHTRK